MDFWVEQNGCGAEPTSEAGLNGRVLRESWTECLSGAEVTLYSLEGWDHRWPGPVLIDQPDGDEELSGFDAARIIWEFFKRHQRPESTDEGS